MSERWDEADLSRVSADDAALDALSAAAFDAVDKEPVLALLHAWQRELGLAAGAQGATKPVSRMPARRSRRWRYATAGIAVAAVLGTTGTAAALGGDHGPLAPVHRMLFGTTSASDRQADLIARVSRLLDQAADQISAARSAGGISGHDRATTARLLDDADGLLVRDVTALDDLRNRSAALRRELAQLPVLPAPSRTPHPSESTAPQESNDDHPAGNDQHPPGDEPTEQETADPDQPDGSDDSTPAPTTEPAPEEPSEGSAQTQPDDGGSADSSDGGISGADPSARDSSGL